jgi:hypothetical protein
VDKLLLLLSVHRASDIRQTQIQTVVPLVPDPNFTNAAIAMFKNYKLPGTDQILADLIQAGGETLWFEIHKLVNSI